MNLSFDPKNKIVSINETGQINIARLYDAVTDWEASPVGMTHDELVEGSGNIELPDGTRSPIYMILLGGWRLAAVHPVWIVGGYVAGRNQDGKGYHPVVEEARDRVHINGDVTQIEGGGDLQAGESTVSGSGRGEEDDDDQDGDVTIEVPAASLGITGHPPSVEITGTSDLVAEPGDRIYLSDPSLTTISNIAEHTASLQRLQELRDELAAVHGADAPDIPGGRNTQEVPLSNDALETARAVVDAAIDLHLAPAVSRPIIDALDYFRQHIEKFGELLDELKKDADKLKGLALAVAAAAGTLAAFIEKVITLLGG